MTVTVTAMKCCTAMKLSPRRYRWKKPLVIRSLFIEQLISDAEKSGGNLTGGENGSLIRLLDCLKPHMPPSFATSFSTVKRTLGGVKKKQSKQKY
jgi:hypothetical protein